MPIGVGDRMERVCEFMVLPRSGLVRLRISKVENDVRDVVYEGVVYTVPKPLS